MAAHAAMAGHGWLGNDERPSEADADEHQGCWSMPRAPALNRLKRRERTDKVLVAFGFTFFVLVVLHIMKKRLGSRLAWLGSSLLSWGQADGVDVSLQ